MSTYVEKRNRKGESMYALFTDTDTDLTPKEAKELGYNLISMPYTNNGIEVYPYVDFEEFDYHTFYQTLRDGAMPHTSGLSSVMYKDYFEPFFKDGVDILYVHFSAAMSGTFDSMKIAAMELKEKYPDRTLYTIDTKGITLGSLNIVKEIGDMYKAGKSIKEIQKWAETEVDKFAVYFFAEDLKFFARSGRVKGFKAFMGNLLGVKPIIYMNSEGVMTSVDTARGKNATITKILSYVETLQDDIKGHRVIIGHSDNLETAKLVADRLKEKFGNDLRIEFAVVNPTAGSHCGPDGVGVSFHAIHR